MIIYLLLSMRIGNTVIADSSEKPLSRPANSICIRRWKFWEFYSSFLFYSTYVISYVRLIFIMYNVRELARRIRPSL